MVTLLNLLARIINPSVLSKNALSYWSKFKSVFILIELKLGK